MNFSVKQNQQVQQSVKEPNEATEQVQYSAPKLEKMQKLSQVTGAAVVTGIK